MAAAVNKDFNSADIQEEMEIYGFFVSDHADSVINIFFLTRERDPGSAAVKHDLTGFLVIVDQGLVLTAAEKLHTGPGSASGLYGDLEFNSASAYSLDRKAAVGNLQSIGCHFILTVIADLTDRSLDKASVLERQLAGKRIGAGPALFPGGEVAVPHFLPGNHDDTVIRHPERLGGIEVKAVVEFPDLIDPETAVFKVHLSQQVNTGVYVLIGRADLREILGAGQYDLLPVQDNIIRALIGAVQAVESMVQVNLPFCFFIKQMSDIFPVQEIFAARQDHVPEAGLLLFFLLVGNRIHGRRFHAQAGSRCMDNSFKTFRSFS